MQLKEFINSVISEIISVVEETELRSDSIYSSEVCPELSQVTANKLDLVVDHNGRLCQKVDFDIAVTVSETKSSNKEKSAKIGVVKVVSVGGDSSDSIASSNSTSSRVKFYIPIALRCKKES